MMERAIFISSLDNLRYFDNGFSRIYFGNEFCEHLVPSITDLKQIMDFASERGINFTFVTPYVTDNGLKRIQILLEKIAEEKAYTEVVFNDYGVLRMLNKKYSHLTPVMGRLLNRMKRGPRLMAVIDKLPQTTVNYFRRSNLTIPILVEFLNTNNVKRVELDNMLQGIDLTFNNMEASLYVPFAYVTTTRLCLANFCDKPELEGMIGILPCKKECKKYTFIMDSEIMPVTLIRKGNTIFFRNDSLPENLDKIGVTRIVVEPEIPM
jgi:hypothetical protein